MSEGRGLQPVEHSGRLGGGRSARLIALAVVAVLGGFIAIGVIGRVPPPPPNVAVASPTAPPTDSPEPQRTPPPSRTIAAIRPDSDAPRPYQFLGTVLHVAGQGFVAELTQVEDGRFAATYRLPFPLLAREAAVEVADIFATTSHETWASLGRWDISLDQMVSEDVEPQEVLDVFQFPRRVAGGSALIRSGFHVVARAEGRPVLNFGLLTIEVSAGIDRPYPNESYAVDARLGDFATRIPLLALGPGHFSATLSVPDDVPGGAMTLALVAMPASNPMLGQLTVHELTVEMPDHAQFESGSGSSVLSDPLPPAPGMPELATFAYQFEVQSRFLRFQRALVLDLQIFGGYDPADRDAGFADMSMTWPPRDYPGPVLGD